MEEGWEFWLTLPVFRNIHLYFSDGGGKSIQYEAHLYIFFVGVKKMSAKSYTLKLSSVSLGITENHGGKTIF